MARLLLQAAHSHENMDVQRQLSDLGRRMQLAGEVAQTAAEEQLQPAAQLIHELLQELQWIDCRLNCDRGVAQAQNLEVFWVRLMEITGVAVGFPWPSILI